MSGSHRVRVTVVRADHPRHGTAVGDFFEVHEHKVVIPPDGRFDLYLMCAIVPVLREKQETTDPGSWINRKPFLLGPDPEEQIVMRMDAIGEDR